MEWCWRGAGGGAGLGQADITVKEQEARLTSVPRLICSMGAASGRVLMSDGDGQVES